MVSSDTSGLTALCPSGSHGSGLYGTALRVQHCAMSGTWQVHNGSALQHLKVFVEVLASLHAAGHRLVPRVSMRRERVTAAHQKSHTTLLVPRDGAKDHRGTLLPSPLPAAATALHILLQLHQHLPSCTLDLRPGKQGFSVPLSQQGCYLPESCSSWCSWHHHNTVLNLPGVQQQQGSLGFLNGCKGERVGIPVVPNLGGGVCPRLCWGTESPSSLQASS